jgi:hypothetical protein
VFLPLLVQIVFACVTLITGTDYWWFHSHLNVGLGFDPIWYDDRWIDRALSMLNLAILFLALLFIALKLDGFLEWYSSCTLFLHLLRSWFATIVPLLVLKGLLVIIPLVLSIFSAACSYHWRSKTRLPSLLL